MSEVLVSSDNYDELLVSSVNIAAMIAARGGVNLRDQGLSIIKELLEQVRYLKEEIANIRLLKNQVEGS